MTSASNETEPEDDASSTQGRQWDALKPNRITCFVMRGDHPGYLRTAEVISLSEDKRSGEFWYWIDGAGTYTPNKPLAQRRLYPEWADERGRTRIKPKPEQRDVWAPRQHTLGIEDIEIIAPVINVRVGGAVAPESVVKVDAWLKRVSKTDARARGTISVKSVGIAHSESADCAEEFATMAKAMRAAIPVLRSDHSHWETHGRESISTSERRNFNRQKSRRTCIASQQTCATGQKSRGASSKSRSGAQKQSARDGRTSSSSDDEHIRGVRERAEVMTCTASAQPEALQLHRGIFASFARWMPWGYGAMFCARRG